MITIDQKRRAIEILMPLAKRDLTKVFCPTGEGGGVDPTCSPPYSIANNLKSKAKIIKEGMGLLRDQGLVLRNHPVIFDGDVRKGGEIGMEGYQAHDDIGGVYIRGQVLEDSFTGFKHEIKASIRLNKKIADSQMVVHEYGHHVDAVMGVARTGNEKADFSDEFVKWGIENTKFDSREDFADLFQALVYKGTSASIGKGFNVSWKGDRAGFHKWFDDEVKQFIKADNSK